MRGAILLLSRVRSQEESGGYKKEGEGKPLLRYVFLFTKMGKDWVKGRSRRTSHLTSELSLIRSNVAVHCQARNTITFPLFSLSFSARPLGSLFFHDMIVEAKRAERHPIRDFGLFF